MTIEESRLAEQYATEAVNKWPDNSYLMDTLGLVYLYELSKMVKLVVECKTTDNDQLRKISAQCWLTCHTFQTGHKISEKEAVRQCKKLNLACHFGELQAIE